MPIKCQNILNNKNTDTPTWIARNAVVSGMKALYIYFLCDSHVQAKTKWIDLHSAVNEPNSLHKPLKEQKLWLG